MLSITFEQMIEVFYARSPAQNVYVFSLAVHRIIAQLPFDASRRQRLSIEYTEKVFVDFRFEARDINNDSVIVGRRNSIVAAKAVTVETGMIG